MFDIELLARAPRRRDALVEPPSRKPPDARIGYFGASTGAAAALWASTDPSAQTLRPSCRGAAAPISPRPRLGAVRAPTLLIVGGDDDVVLELNRSARAQMRCETALQIVPGATHLFEEPGTLAAAAELARDWFVDHLRSGPSAGRLTAATEPRRCRRPAA